jgi:hypothetical protein
MSPFGAVRSTGVSLPRSSTSRSASFGGTRRARSQPPNKATTTAPMVPTAIATWVIEFNQLGAITAFARPSSLYPPFYSQASVYPQPIRSLFDVRQQGCEAGTIGQISTTASLTDAPGRSCPSGAACRDARPRAPINRTPIAPSLLTADGRQLNADQAELYEAGYRWSTSRARLVRSGDATDRRLSARRLTACRRSRCGQCSRRTAPVSRRSPGRAGRRGVDCRCTSSRSGRAAW